MWMFVESFQMFNFYFLVSISRRMKKITTQKTAKFLKWYKRRTKNQEAQNQVSSNVCEYFRSYLSLFSLSVHRSQHQFRPRANPVEFFLNISIDWTTVEPHTPSGVATPSSPALAGLRPVSAPETKPRPTTPQSSLPPGQNICADCERLIV